MRILALSLLLFASTALAQDGLKTIRGPSVEGPKEVVVKPQETKKARITDGFILLPPLVPWLLEIEDGKLSDVKGLEMNDKEIERYASQAVKFRTPTLRKLCVRILELIEKEDADAPEPPNNEED